MNRFKTLFLVVAMLLVAALPAAAQATLTSTTLSAAVTTQGTTTITVASATGFSAGRICYVDREAMRITGVNSTLISVIRGYSGTRAVTHASGATVYVGPPNYFIGYDLSGSCTATSELVLPRINVSNGQMFNCIGSEWLRISREIESTAKNVGTANTGVTAVEYGDGRFHVTKLTFTNLAVGSSAGAANLAFGKLLYTLPAGAILNNTAHINIAVTGSGATCDADTPDGGLGILIGSGANATLDAVGANAENILTGQTFNDCNGTAEILTSGTAAGLEAAGARTVYFNLADGWAGACDFTATGTVTLEWMLLP